MKKLMVILLLTLCSGVAFSIPCNWSDGSWCCAFVGDGGAMSCTNGSCWTCIGDCAPGDVESECLGLLGDHIGVE